jgi:hypothetical protein
MMMENFRTGRWGIHAEDVFVPLLRERDPHSFNRDSPHLERLSAQKEFDGVTLMLKN